MWKSAVWLGIPQTEIECKKIFQGDLNGRFAYYRCDLEFNQPAELVIAITANSRYRFWVNGKPVLSGPCKGDRYRHYYEKVVLTDYLQQGLNRFAAQVLLTDSNSIVNQGDERTPILSVASLPAGHRLAIEGQAFSQNGELLADLTTGTAPWRVRLDNSYYLKCKPINVNLGAIAEDIDFALTPSDWKTGEINPADWSKPKELDQVVPNEFMLNAGLLPKFQVKERPIPLLYEIPDVLSDELGTSHFNGNDTLTVPAHAKQTVIFDHGSITNAYMIYRFAGGNRARVAMTYFEKFINKNRIIHRMDFEHGEIEGLTDELRLAGENLCYEPFWFRTFRFVSMTIETADEELVIKLPKMLKTGYPLNPISTVQSSSAAWVKPVWDMCIRTLQGCMTETYMDCPFYEQMQFPMDTRLQALFTYACSEDTQLARKAIIDFHHSIIPDGLVQGKYPSSFVQVISTFSLHYIFMLYEYYDQTGDQDLLKYLRSDVDAILEYYDRKIGQDGLVQNLDYWPFVDWQDDWKVSFGMPKAGLSGPSTIINLMYAYALDVGACICEATGRKGLAGEYRLRQEAILDRIQQVCWDEDKGLYREGPRVSQYSQHAQAWAILNKMLAEDDGRRLLETALADSSVISCTFATSYELHRAMVMTGLFDEVENNLRKWSDLIDLGCTTCPETPGLTRSDCHAWSALPLLEMIRVIAGISSPEPGWPSILIAPHLGSLTDLSGEAATPRGVVRFSFFKHSEGLNYEVELPDGLEGVFRHPNGTEEILISGMNQGGLK